MIQLGTPPKKTSASHINDALNNHALKQEFLECLDALSQDVANLRELVRILLKRGFRRQQLKRWAAEAGYADGYVRDVLNSILREEGFRQRRPGAGPKIPQEALLILAESVERYGAKAGKFLLAAYRAYKRQTAADKAVAGHAQPITRIALN